MEEGEEGQGVGRRGLMRLPADVVREKAGARSREATGLRWTLVLVLYVFIRFFVRAFALRTVVCTCILSGKCYEFNNEMKCVLQAQMRIIYRR